MLEFARMPRLTTTGILAAFLSLDAGGAAHALYDVSPAEVPGKPGSIIRIWPLEGGGPGMGGMGDSFRILYRSTDPSGRPIPVSGAIYIPNGPAPAGGRNIIAWAHPTSGVVPPCAPSLMPDVGGMMWNLPNMITQGYIVVATDYPGLGTEASTLSDRREDLTDDAALLVEARERQSRPWSCRKKRRPSRRSHDCIESVAEFEQIERTNSR
jgi:hypothetical protein